MADADNLRRLWRYKSDLEEGPDEEKLIEILSKLKRVPVTVSSLQETGMGKLINRFGKQGGVVGEKAAAVVALWKTVVEKEVEKARMPSPAPPPKKEDSDAESDVTSWDSYDTQREGSSTPTCDKRNAKQVKDQRYHQAKIAVKTHTSSRESHGRQQREKEITTSTKRHSESTKMKESDSSKVDKKDRHKDPGSRHHSSHRNNESSSHSLSRDSTRSKTSHSDSGKEGRIKHSDNASAKYESTKKVPRKISDEEELTDSDEAFAEESTGASNIEEYYKKMLEQSTSNINNHSEERERKGSGRKDEGSREILSKDRKDRDAALNNHRRKSSLSSSGGSSSKETRVDKKHSTSSHSSSSKSKDVRIESSHNKQKDQTAQAVKSGTHQSKSLSSSHQHNDRHNHKKSPQSKSSEGRSSSSHISVPGKGSKEHSKVDRKRKHHSVSESEEEEDAGELPQKQSRRDSRDRNNHGRSKDSTSRHSHSKSPHHRTSQQLKVKTEKTDDDEKYGGGGHHKNSGAVKKEKGPQHIQQMGGERSSGVEEDLYSPKHVAVKKEKTWSPSPSSNRAHYSPTPISRPQKIKTEGSDIDSVSVGSYSPSTATVLTSQACPELHSEIEDKESYRYSPHKIVTGIKRENVSSVTSSRETAPSYNPTPINRERSVSPCPPPYRPKSEHCGSANRHSRKESSHSSDEDREYSPTRVTQIKLEPCHSQSQSSSEELSPAHSSSPVNRNRSKHYRPSPGSHSSKASSSPGSASPQSLGPHRTKQSSLSASNSSCSEDEDIQRHPSTALRGHSKDKMASSPNHSSDDASRGYIPTQSPIGTDQEELSNSDMSDGAESYHPSHSQRTPLSSKQREIKSNYLPSRDSEGGTDDEEDRYSPMPLSNKIKEEPYSPTPKSSSAKISSGDLHLKSSSHKERHKSHKVNSSSHNHGASPSPSDQKISKSSSSYQSSSSSTKHKDHSSLKSSHLSSSRKHSKSSDERDSLKHISSSRERHGSSSHDSSSSTKTASSKSHDKPKYLSSSARNSPVAHSDISHVSSASYPDCKRKSSSSSSSKHRSNRSSHTSSSTLVDKGREHIAHVSSSNSKSSSSGNSSEKYTSQTKASSSSTSKSSSKSSSHRYNESYVNKDLNNSCSRVKTHAPSNSGSKISSSSGKKKSKTLKHKSEEPELDLFSDTLTLKAVASSSKLKAKTTSALPHKSSRKSESMSPAPSISPTPSVSPPPPPSFDARHKNRKKTSSKGDYEKAGEADSLFNIDSEEEFNDAPALSHKKPRVQLDEKEEAQMSFEDFMNFDSAALLNKGKSSATSSSQSKKMSSSLSQSRSSHHKSSYSSSLKASTSKSRSSHSSAEEKFHIPVPARNVKVTELDILSSLPETQALYRPLPPRKHEFGGEEIEEGASQGNLEDIGLRKLARTLVYSGRRQGVTEVKSLFDLCMQLLIENIDALDCVGGVPYDVLKPVLERCTAQQLYHLEDYNPHFLEDSDELWEKLCQRDFRGSKPEEMELWREMYLRKHNEREIKYQKLKETFSSTIVKGQTGRKAQLAYVDSQIKPPRDVLRRQMKFGTGCVKMNKGRGAGVKPYKPSVSAPVYNPMTDRPRVVKPVAPMMARAINMRKNMRR